MIIYTNRIVRIQNCISLYRKYFGDLYRYENFVHLNWMRLVTNLRCVKDSVLGSNAARENIFRCCLRFKINMNLASFSYLQRSIIFYTRAVKSRKCKKTGTDHINLNETKSKIAFYAKRNGIFRYGDRKYGESELWNFIIYSPNLSFAMFFSHFLFHLQDSHY